MASLSRCHVWSQRKPQTLLWKAISTCALFVPLKVPHKCLSGVNHFSQDPPFQDWNTHRLRFSALNFPDRVQRAEHKGQQSVAKSILDSHVVWTFHTGWISWTCITPIKMGTGASIRPHILNHMQCLGFQAVSLHDSPLPICNYLWSEILKGFWKSYSLMGKPLTYFIKLNRYQS